MKKSWCPRSAQWCNKLDILEDSFEMASATALFCLEKGLPLYPKRRFPEMVWSKFFQGAPLPDPHRCFLLHIEWYQNWNFSPIDFQANLHLYLLRI